VGRPRVLFPPDNDEQNGMRFSLAGYILGLGAVGLLLVTTLSRGDPSSPIRSGITGNDSTGARLLVERQGERVRVQGAFTNDGTGKGMLTYELDVRRTGDTGTSQSTQSGQFETAPGQTDTLSTVQVNVQPGDRMALHLTIRRDGTLIDEVRQQRTF
jgi:hypothetical protein